MLQKRSRLPSQKFRSRGYQTASTPYFSLKARVRDEGGEGGNRIGIVVGMAVHKSAARRNFWKRQAKAALMDIEDANKDFLVILSPKVNSLSKKQFRKILFETAMRLTKLT